MMRSVCAIGVTLGLAGMLASCCAAGEEAEVLSVREAVQLALARDALVREAQQSLENARAELVRTSAYTPTLRVGSGSSATTTTGLDPESAVSGTEYSSRSYESTVAVPMPGGTYLQLGASASTSTTNSALRTGEEMEFTYAGAEVGASIARPLALFRDERVLTEGRRWAAGVSLRRAEATLEEARRKVVGDTLTYFFTALRAQRQAEIREASRQEAEELLRIAQEKLRRGKLAEIEVMEAKVSADSAGVACRKAESAAASTLEALKNFLGIGLDQGVRLSQAESGLPTRSSLDTARMIEHALVERTDLQQLALDVRLAELSSRRVEAGSRPGIYLEGRYARSGEAETIGESFRDLVNPSWYVGIAATTSLTRREDRAEMERARSALRLAQLEEQLRRDEVRLEIRRLVREAEDAAANAAVLAETVKMAEENLRIRQVQFENGLVRPIDVTQTERQLSEARGELLNASIDQQLAAARLSLAVGEMPFRPRAQQGESGTVGAPSGAAESNDREARG